MGPREGRLPLSKNVQYQPPACTQICSPSSPALREQYPQGTVVSKAYEHVDRTYCGRPENRKAFDSNEILRIPSVMNGTIPQLRSWPGNPATYVGFNMYACQMSHTSKGGL